MARWNERHVEVFPMVSSGHGGSDWYAMEWYAIVDIPSIVFYSVVNTVVGPNSPGPGQYDTIWRIHTLT